MTKVEASETETLAAQAARHLWMAFQPPTPHAASGGPKIMVSAEGCWMSDSEGRRYLDGVGALEACILGHTREDLARVAYDQMRALEFCDVFRYTSPPTVELAAKLAAIAPGDLNRVHFTPGGSEAVETAIKVARQYQRLIGQHDRFKVVTRVGAYHGCTFGAMAVDGNYFSTRPEYYQPLPPVRLIAPAPYHYRCHDCAAEPACRLDCLDDIERMMVTERPETIAAMIVDPCSTATAVAIPPPDYMPRLRELCSRYGILLIVDEVITGFGRTGSMFASDHWGIVPDIMTVSKGISSGYVPIGATIVSDRVADVFEGHPEGTLSHGQTYGGHPVATAVALANINIIERDGLPARARELGERFRSRLREVAGQRRCFGEVRGLGLLNGLEFVVDQETKAIPKPVQEAGYLMRMICRDIGLITLTLHPGNVLLLAPPLTISEAELESMVMMLDQALAEFERRFEQR